MKKTGVNIILFLLSISIVNAVPLRVGVLNESISFMTDDGITNVSIPNTPWNYDIEVNNSVIETITTNVTVEQIIINNTQESLIIQNYTYDCPYNTNLSEFCPSLSCPATNPCPACALNCPSISCPEPNLSEIVCEVNDTVIKNTEGAYNEIIDFKQFFNTKFENVTSTQTGEAQKREQTTIMLLIILIFIVLLGIIAYFAYKLYFQKKGGNENKLLSVRDEIRNEKIMKSEEASNNILDKYSVNPEKSDDEMKIEF